MDELMKSIKSDYPELFINPRTPQNEHSAAWVRCIDDTLLWAESLIKCLKQTFLFVQECAFDGVVFNQRKFQFAMEEVEALGFNITQEGIEPTKGYLDALKNYPTPKCLKDMRAFSGFLNQSAFMSREKTREAMGLIRKRLMSTQEWDWTEEDTVNYKKCKEIACLLYTSPSPRDS